MKYLACRRKNRCQTAGRIYKASENKAVGNLLYTAIEKAVKSENKGFRKEYRI